jgi:hypothetical protein
MGGIFTNNKYHIPLVLDLICSPFGVFLMVIAYCFVASSFVAPNSGMLLAIFNQLLLRQSLMLGYLSKKVECLVDEVTLGKFLSSKCEGTYLSAASRLHFILEPSKLPSNGNRKE